MMLGDLIRAIRRGLRAGQYGAAIGAWMIHGTGIRTPSLRGGNFPSAASLRRLGTRPESWLCFARSVVGRWKRVT